MELTPEELKAHYAAKMAAWSDERLAHELTLKENDSWATPAVMAIWNTCLDAEAYRRKVVE